ncbi:hypothetical protein HAX54_007259 [Datura stramonium]|uniref:Peptidase S8/S53 domain-containing protein n=1 Tax=Datura stramonium TaxID=4076 RepID=A0ABS8TD90_DATST|nr:hypothetical protein [Datura stramonium]
MMKQMEIPGFSTKNQVNVIIGFIDTGIWPESPSFSDTKMPPVPTGWKGQCQSGEAFNASVCTQVCIWRSHRGGAPMARIAVYKTCWSSGCYDVDLLAAFDDAIRDGVHVISLSLGPDAPQGDYFNDAISVGSFHAVSRGILVVASVGK